MDYIICFQNIKTGDKKYLCIDNENNTCLYSEEELQHTSYAKILTMNYKELIRPYLKHSWGLLGNALNFNAIIYENKEIVASVRSDILFNLVI